jgi:DNA-binding transcriptional MocR family regulator
MTEDLLPALQRDVAGASTLVDQIVDGVRRAIGERRLLAGNTLPSVRGLARTCDVSTFTVADAYRRLVALGVVTSHPGAGYRVTESSAPRTTSAPTWVPPRFDADWLLSEVYADHSVPIKTGCGWLPGDWVIEPGLRNAIRATSRLPAEQFGDYGHPYGHAALRVQIARLLHQHGLRLDEARVLMTQGATHGLDLVARLLLRPEDVVVVEDPCYCNLLPILRLARVHVLGVERTAEGLDLDALEAIVKEHRPRALFLTPALHNPTGATLSPTAAFRILQVAERVGMWVVEDDVNRELLPEAAPLLAALEGLRRVIYLGGYSKTISPALRVGYVCAEPAVLTELARIKMATGLTSSSIAEKVVYRALIDGHYGAHVAQIRERLATAHERVASRLTAAGAELFDAPGAGLFRWARLPIKAADAASVTARALSDGIWLAPGSYFSPRGEASSWFRFNVSFSDSPVLWKFLRGLG